MAFIIKYDEITDFYSATNTQLTTWDTNLSDIKSKLEVFTSMDSLSGKSAENIKRYLMEVNGNIIHALGEIFMEFQSKLLLYRDGFYSDVDDGLYTVVTQDSITSCRSSVKQEYGDFLDLIERAIPEANKVSDLVGSLPSHVSIDLGYSTLLYKMKDIVDKVEEYDTYHEQNDFSTMEELILSLTAFCNEMMEQDVSSDMKSYQAGGIQNMASYQALSDAYGVAYQERAELALEIQRALENEEVRQNLLQQAEDREQQGWISFISGTVLVIGGIACIVFSGGTATPFVAALAATSGITTLGFGLSEMGEGLENAYYGSVGDTTSVAYNSIRDSLFFGNQTAYNIGMTVSTTSSLFFSFGVGGYNAFAAGGWRAAGVYGGKVVLSSGIGLGIERIGEYSALQAGLSPAQARAIGTFAGLFSAALAGWGLNTVDKNLNLSGTNPKVVVEETIKSSSTGTVWDDIEITQTGIDGTTIPKSFEMTINGEKIWVNPNATKHMIEYSTNMMPNAQKLTEQQLLRSLQSASQKAIANGYQYEKLIIVDNWQLIFSAPREVGQLPVLKHALYLP